ncbi:TetR family transcriptional regulator [Bacillus sp. FJAT-27916]|uniref:dihydroxyacetone kinase transcriptional activator DhaS n=1 Tax=Bacillaceae TaxID=186817 RepID=UPI0006709731|nr:dihydroxyacetone kinase transcriptional activator DhaS [Bacillus sp. FJAT-27916]KMY45743.1 TetR family transcriptional regulator [Bacillus sp. FJAT-27916]
MTSSIITKKIIAKSLKDLMETESFHKISVSDIMGNCQMRRQTFYYHFQDKYELLGWIYKEETQENITDFIGYERWENILELLLSYFSRNRRFYRNAFTVTEQNSFNGYLFEHTKNLSLEIIDKEMMKEKQSIAAAEKELLASFYSHGFVGMIQDWIEQDCQTDKVVMSALMKNMMNDMLQTAMRGRGHEKDTQ